MTGTGAGEPAHVQDIARTPIFDGDASRRGLPMNKLLMSLVSSANRERFLGDPAAYCQQYHLTAPQQQAILGRHWQAMVDLGGSIFYIYKLAMMDGLSMQYLGGVFTGMSEQEFVSAMKAGGRHDG